MIYTFYHNSETLIVRIACDIPNKQGYFSLCVDRSVIVIKFDLRFFNFKTDYFPFYFLNIDSAFNI